MFTTTKTRRLPLDAFGSLKLLKTEMIITQTLAVASLLVVFQRSIGLSQAQVGFAQAIFTIVLLAATIPTGVLADKFSRKLCNAGGDFLVAIGFILYAHIVGIGLVVAHTFGTSTNMSNFIALITAEVIVGIGSAFSKGADDALQGGYAEETGISVNRIQRFISTRAPIAQIIMVWIGGLAGQNDFSWAFYVTAVPFFIGGLLSLLMKESGARYISKHRNPFKDIARLTHTTLSDDPGLRWLLLAHALGSKLSLPFLLALGPLLGYLGAPLLWLPYIYVLRFACKSVGAHIGGKYSNGCSPWVRYAVPSVMLIAALSAMAIDLRAVWGAVFVVGLTEGWFSAITTPMIINRASTDLVAARRAQSQNKKDILATVSSVADTAAQGVFVLLIVSVSLIAGNNYHAIIAISLIAALVTLPVTVRRLRQTLPDQL